MQSPEDCFSDEIKCFLEDRGVQDGVCTIQRQHEEKGLCANCRGSGQNTVFDCQYFRLVSGEKQTEKYQDFSKSIDRECGMIVGERTDL
jgi:hypothetical protein